MLKTRLITAAVLLPIVLSAFLWGPAWLIGAFLYLCLSLCLFEIVSILIPACENRLATSATPGAQRKSKMIFPLLTIGLGWLLFFISTGSQDAGRQGLVVVVLLASMLIGIIISRKVEMGVVRSFAIVVSLVYGVLPWLSVWNLYLMGSHSRYIILILGITWMGDTGGYFGGRLFGNKLFKNLKLAPLISPNKTWEGAISGLILSVIGAFLINAGFQNELAGPYVILACGVFGSIFGQLGDLVESALKRFGGVKDSGVIIPGHGGFLDRVDAILFSAPAIWFVLYYFR